jgi:hypothetical protein
MRNFFGKIGQKAELTFLQQCPKSAKPKLKKSGLKAGSENGSTKQTVKKTGEFSAFLDQMRQSRIW